MSVFDSRNPYRPLISLADFKSNRLAGRLAEKQQRQEDPAEQLPRGTGPLDADLDARLRAYREGGGSTAPGITANDLGDLAGSSLVRMAGTFGDLGGEIGNLGINAFRNNVMGLPDTPVPFFDTDRDMGFSNQETADEIAGVRPGARQRLQEGYQSVLSNVSEGNYGQAAIEALKVGPGFLADSAASLVEYAAGVGLVATGAGAIPGGALLAKKGKDAVRSFQGLRDAYDAAKSNKVLSKVDDAVKSIGKSAAETSFITADIVQNTIQDYRETYDGQDPSAERVMGMIAVNMAAATFQGEIFKRVYFPFSKIKGGIKNLPKDAQAIQQRFKDDVKKAVKYADETTMRSLLNTIGAGITKIGTAGGAEAVQEYAQAWAEILSVKMSPKEAENLLTGVLNEVQNEENINESIANAFIGGAAGGSGKAITTVPTAAASTALDVTKGAAQLATKPVKAANVKKIVKNLSSDQSKQVQANFEIAQRNADDLEQRNAELTATLTPAESFDAISDEDVRNDLLSVADGLDLQTESGFKTAKNRLLRRYKSDAAVARTAAQAQRATAVAAAETKRAASAVAAVVNVDLDKVIEKAQDLGEAAVEEIKNFQSSATLGFAETVLDYTAKQTKGGFNKVSDLAKENSPEGIRSVADAIRGKFPEVASRLDSLADQQMEDLKKVGLRTDTLVNSGSLDQSIKSAAQSTTIRPQDLPGLGGVLFETQKGTFEDLQTLETFEKALNKYKETNQTELDADTIAAIEQNIADQRTRMKAEPLQRAADFVGVVAAQADPFIASTADVVSEIAKATAKGLDTVVGSFVDFVTTRPSEKTEKTVQSGRKGYVVKNSEGLQSFLDQIGSRVQAIQNSDDVDGNAEALGKLLENLANPAVIQKISREAEISDPEVMMDMLAEIVPAFAEPRIREKYKPRVEEALKDVQQFEVTETELTGDREVATDEMIQADDGTIIVDSVLDQKQVYNWLVKVVGEDKICKL